MSETPPEPSSPLKLFDLKAWQNHPEGSKRIINISAAVEEIRKKMNPDVITLDHVIPDCHLIGNDEPMDGPDSAR